ncbi:2Fe-2S iron-sulfur cluster-binding domain / NADH-ubiquinone oxidoreductase-G iron-sulfur binding region / [FeFe] hydrogenase, group A / iron hydrogenase, small subunit multi-domain protein [Lachnoanaerobaculum saburreum F0468]|jgi:hydrogenase, Fe-only|uniref:2Fe-2S iron-sulfur cluster-binding domain / NADH-ubiquinone oxidoreductase-G iron-sulfur binding region / [FeFe] hydrogenase, group A / iron hydrogenase, small subunit multi-domain protein n=2 Tax=Lachnoanaerobaculum saburreum TaxID=467210 RepID=I0R4Q8_9FIRM|nr:[FeFe] hydrogenase, group A [Lachnoanaerobaculum saburreum]EFU77980.1 hydrogenase, Fe-only [Lachnoanaerobaculum saburreum DSM 3986]EIC94666.1 2Fe-2S iron-sulfur cluster-binding domain / NADH-ubiquinone oxidoreductase-G iron-sulfur binding region / [FeFe] hydrogenase, group A / iron hydrogenase, small subunit multi-domain protein [Lachnoanaerobaculum saburreum F0468]RKW36992.1 MAG: 4Fe-4S dicluster domain-containing protein [Lachnospiraceae bacterium]
MVNLTIDNIPVSVKENTTIMEAAAGINIEIPKLCFLKGLNEIAACRVCVVELKGKDKLITSCNNVCEEGMEIFTNSKKVIRDRRKTVELILSQHDNRCVICAKSGNCSLQKVANDLNILEIPFAVELEKQPWNKNFPLIRDSSKCIKCMRCIQVCDKMQTLSVWDLHGTGARTTVNVTGYKKIEDANCSLCGQCITHCPVGALSERDDTSKFWDAVADPEKTVVVQIAPAVRTAWGEVFGLKDKDATVGKIVDALKKMGADYVFDTSFSADLTIMEEANEFVHRYTNGLIGDRPMFTSCCPGWVRFAKSQFPRMAKSLSTAKSPQQMFGAVMKSYFAEKIGVNPENMVSVSIMPCVAKKGEREMELFHGEYAGHDVDIALTTRELTRMIRASHIDPKSLKDVVADRPMGEYSGAGVIFGTTGGVMEAALRTAYSIIKKENPPSDAFKPVRSKSFQENDGTVEAKFKIDDIELNIAVVSGLGNTRKLINKIERGEVKYDFVEVMACPGGCVGGGGQPVKDGYELAFNRGKKLYFLDENSEIRYSHENRDIIALYDEYFHKPLSHKAHELLHVHE